MQKICKRKSALTQISLPVLIQHGGKDKIIDLKGSYYLKKNIINSKTELIVYPKSNHSLFWDCDSSKAFKDIVHWVLKN
jgi:esterase/lipase